MSKAEDRALEAYPSTPNWDERITCMYRGGFIKGYHQAEKDLELTWEDIASILDIIDIIANDDSMEERLKNMSEEEYCQEILKRFKEIKK